MANPNQRETESAVVTWLRSIAKDKLKIAVVLGDTISLAGYLHGYKDGFLALRTSEHDLSVIPISSIVCFHVEYMQGVPAPLAGFHKQSEPLQT